MNKRSTNGNLISRSLPFHIQIYPLTQQQIDTRVNGLRKEFYRNKALYYKKNSFIRQMIETNQYLCYHCHKAIIPDRLNVSNRKNLYHLKCALLINMIPDDRPLVTKNTRLPPKVRTAIELNESEFLLQYRE